MNRAAIYVRVSTDEQAETGHSLEAQLDACRSFASVRGWTVAAGHEFVDAGFSGGKSDRPAWNAMQTAANAGAFDVLIVHKLDRFSRDVIAGLRVVNEFRAIGVSFVSVMEQFDFTSPTGEVMLTMMLAFAQLYLANLRQEVHKGKLQKAKKGLTNGNAPPFGYRRVDGHDVVEPGEAELWRQAMKMVAEGATDLDIADWLNGQKVTMPSGRLFTRVAVREMLINPFYIGRVKWRGLDDRRNSKGDRKRKPRHSALEFPGGHEAIIDLELWKAAQERRRSRGTGGGGVRKRAYLLLGIAHCAECGGRLTCVGRDGKSPRYACRAYERNYPCSCNRMSVIESKLERQVDEFIENLDISEDVIRQAAALALQDDPRTAADRRAAEIAAEMKRIDMLFQKGRLDQRRWETETSRLESELAGLSPVPAEPASTDEIRNLLDAWSAASDHADERNAVLDAILKSVDVDLREGRIVAWHARPEFEAAAALAVKNG